MEVHYSQTFFFFFPLFFSHFLGYHHFYRFASPMRVNLYTFSFPSPSVRFSINHHSISPNHHSNRSTAVSKKTEPILMPKKTCMCSPTSQNTGSFPSNRLNMCRSDMTNSLVRIGGLEGGGWTRKKGDG
ncbi:hypothetical protein D8674_027620 [Pyrus ussuriensis x Pyrus communis]|uniref:Uncharacterized protein n=1 Tax=Pyrus ussuriensis x Pyrus communis TaxID=2448454 RepID=A0A5N5IA75_9ROSA|nr:hypothetical protein D8674_027620 [Pyrus ussuriensis x Pyrus communis]